MKQYRRQTINKLIILLVLIVVFPTFLSLLSLPDYCQIIKGNKEYLEVRFPGKIAITAPQSGNLKINGQRLTDSGLEIDGLSSVAIQAFSPGKFNLNFHLFGIIPIQKMVVKVIPEVKVIPGGQCIGVMLQSEGIMVVKSSYVLGKQGKKHFPAQQAGIEVGDSLLQVNGIQIKNKYHLAKLINKLGRKQDQLEFKVKKQTGKVVSRTIDPVKSKQGYYMIGIYVDDGAAGVGTMSFYHPESKYYGALGHMITELNTKLKIDVKEGEIVKADVSGINQSQMGQPGEKLGTFFSKRQALGNIKKNNRLGIYGKLASAAPQNPYFEDPIPVASPSEVEEGSASIYTVINGRKIEKFAVKIEEVKRQYQPQPKGLVVKIVDQELLRKTGGIIQGMSGSPIVQDNKLVGAVTHVFVNDAARGYGVLAQWMIIKSGLLDQTKKNTRELAS